ncbi:helix-turn-helix transcriptional regulator [Natronorubrum halophilum]|uniref:helix-turn-helix transcriptional regulator n=1 Tax=Natronorubrum halophilum TaxID=1702106 RepID=UPI0013CF0B81|nr:helix-turn-helix domain-containing protein [Natronorubrum halophilum]
MFEAVMRHETLLQRLSEQPARSDELATDLETSRSTIHRWLSALQRDGLVEQVDGRYRLTLTGTLALAEFERLLQQLETIVAARDILRSIPDDTAIDPSLFVGATVVLGDRSRTKSTSGPIPPIEPREAFRALLETGTHLRGVAPGLNEEVIAAVQDALSSGPESDERIELAIAVPHDTVETLLTTFREPTAAALETGRLTLCETTAPLPYGLLVLERDGRDVSREVDLDIGSGPITALVVCDETGIRGLLVTDDSDALEWATETLADVWVDSEPLSTL